MTFLKYLRPVAGRRVSLLLPAFLALAFLVGSCTPPTTGVVVGDLDFPVMTDQPTPLKTFRVVPDCRADLPRESLVNVYWENPAAGRQTQRLDISPFKRGFQTGHFYSLLTAKGERFRRVEQTKDSPNLDTSCEKLSNRDFQTVEKDGQARLALGGLVPGMTYFLRISSFDASSKQWLPSQIVRFDAPVCRNDQVDEK